MAGQKTRYWPIILAILAITILVSGVFFSFWLPANHLKQEKIKRFGWLWSDRQYQIYLPPNHYPVRCCRYFLNDKSKPCLWVDLYYQGEEVEYLSDWFEIKPSAKNLSVQIHTHHNKQKVILYSPSPIACTDEHLHPLKIQSTSGP
jgi:hypothetical protein